MENYYSVPKILGGQEPGVKIIGGPPVRRPTGNPCAGAHDH